MSSVSLSSDLQYPIVHSSLHQHCVHVSEGQRERGREGGNEGGGRRRVGYIHVDHCNSSSGVIVCVCVFVCLCVCSACANASPQDMNDAMIGVSNQVSFTTVCER